MTEKKMTLPTAIIVSYSNCPASDLAKGMLLNDKSGDLRAGHACTECDDCLETFVWHIDTRYYTADVELVAVNKGDIPVGNLMNEKLGVMEALIIQFESRDKQSYERAKTLVKLLGDYEPDVRILVCDNCSHKEESSVQKIEVQEWCIKNGFEVVELDADEASDSEDDFAETTGIKRIVQALHAHQWPNLLLKDKPSSSAPAFEHVHHQPSNKNPALTELVETAMKNMSVDSKLDEKNKQGFELLPEADLLAVLEDHNTDNESFEALLEKFKSMKDKAQNLPPSERKEYAERVAIAFWKAIGGDDEEIEGIGDEQI